MSEQPRSLHPPVAETLRHFDYGHLPEHLRAISEPFHDLAHDMATKLEGPQLTLGLQRLLEAKDCMVRAAAIRP